MRASVPSNWRVFLCWIIWPPPSQSSPKPGKITYPFLRVEEWFLAIPTLSAMKSNIRSFAGLLLITVLLVVLGMAFFIEPARMEVTYHDMRHQSDDQGLRLVQLSDLHLQAVGKHEKALVNQVKELRPDLVVLTGDMIDRADALPLLQAFVEDLGPIPLIAVPGNWEHWSDVDFSELRAAIENRQGNRLLVNGQSSFTKGKRTIQLIGLDDFTGGNPDLELLERTGSLHRENVATTVLLQHSPGFFDLPEVPRLMGSGRFPLCLSGHTHGGQITIGRWAPFTPGGSGHFVAGFYDIPGSRLYVSRGIGMSIIAARLGSRPEIAVFDL
ncbi:metallophosphoesterase [Chlorobium sp. N1]|nr:metallophosphoesterase [Chlorobium sp. N1]